MTAMSTPVEIRWRRFWGVSTRCHVGSRRGLLDGINAHTRPPSGTGPSARVLRGWRNGTILVTSAGRQRRTTR